MSKIDIVLSTALVVLCAFGIWLVKIVCNLH